MLMQLWPSSLFHKYLLRCALAFMCISSLRKPPIYCICPCSHITHPGFQRASRHPSIHSPIILFYLNLLCSSNLVHACCGYPENDLLGVQVDAEAVGFWVTYGWQSLTRSWSVVPGWRPRIYRFVLLSCSPALLLPLLMVVVLLLLLVLGLGGAIWWLEGDTYVCCRTNNKQSQISDFATVHKEAGTWSWLYTVM